MKVQALILSILSLVGFLILTPSQAEAQRHGLKERVVVDFFGQQYRGQGNILKIGRHINQQLGRGSLQDYEIRRVKLVAKSRRGQGQATLLIGRQNAGSYNVPGVPRDFGVESSWTYHEIVMRPNMRHQSMPVQIELRGNIKVDRVVVVLKPIRHGGGHGRVERVRVTCESFRRSYEECDVLTSARLTRIARRNARIESVQLVRDHSRRTSCERNFNYGFFGTTVWVDDGCKATFEVTLVSRDGFRNPRPNPRPRPRRRF